jgi:hypothetical protein
VVGFLVQEFLKIFVPLAIGSIAAGIVGTLVGTHQRQGWPLKIARAGFVHRSHEWSILNRLSKLHGRRYGDVHVKRAHA